MRTAPLILALLTFSAVPAFAEWESTILPKGFTYEASLSKAIDRAAQEGKAVVLYYTRTNCPPCDALRQRLRNDPVGEIYRNKYVFSAVWGSSMSKTEQDQFRGRYGFGGAPAWMFFNSQGTYLCTARGGVFESDEEGIKLHTAVQAMIANPAVGTGGSQNCMGRKP